MESTNSNKISIFHIILFLCFLNLVGIGYLIMKVRTGESTIPSSQLIPLPPGLDSAEKRAALFERFKTPYNAKNYDDMYALFDEVVRVQVSKEKTISVLDGLYNKTGMIKSGAYGYYEAQKKAEGIVFTLYYPLRTEKGENAVLQIGILQQGKEPYRFIKFQIG